MANKTERSFTFDVDGVPRCLFRSYENTTGTVILNLIPWGHPNYKPYISTDASEPFTPNIDSPLKQSRYSIHTSDDNPRNETYIKLTDDYANGRQVTSVSFAQPRSSSLMITHRYFADVLTTFAALTMTSHRQGFDASIWLNPSRSSYLWLAYLWGRGAGPSIAMLFNSCN